MISHISLGSIVPSPLTSYIWNAHSSFCSGFPADVMLMANRNSLKSIFPLLSESNVRNTWAQNLSALPWGKKLEYTSRNLARDSWPSGQSFCTPCITDVHLKMATITVISVLVYVNASETNILRRVFIRKLFSVNVNHIFNMYTRFIRLPLACLTHCTMRVFYYGRRPSHCRVGAGHLYLFCCIEHRFCDGRKQPTLYI